MFYCEPELLFSSLFFLTISTVEKESLPIPILSFFLDILRKEDLMDAHNRIQDWKRNIKGDNFEIAIFTQVVS